MVMIVVLGVALFFQMRSDSPIREKVVVKDVV